MTNHATSESMEDTINLRESNAVLETYELVEHILSYLDFLDLIHAYQVCRQWRNIALRSQVLRFHLFLQPQDYEDKAIHGKQDFTRPGIGRRLARTIHPNPVLRYYPRHGFTSFPCEISLRYQDVLGMLNWHSGLWESMLMSIPPPRKVVIRIGGARWSGDYDTIANDSGIRLGHLRSSMTRLLRAKDGLDWKEDLMRKVEMLGLKVHIYEE